MRSIAWDDFRIVQLIAEHRSLGGAAHALNLNHSTIFRRLNNLEDALGTRLFERARAGYALTPAGEEMVALAERMAESIIDFERRIAGRDLRPTGELRLTTTDTIFAALLAPLLKTFRQRYPEITLDIVVESRTLNLSKRDADVAIRAATEPPDTLVGRRIAAVAWAPYAPVGFTFETGLAPCDFTGPWVGFGDPINMTTAGRWFQANIPERVIGAKVNTVAALHDAVAAGLGIGILPCLIGDRSERVARLGDPIPAAASSLWLLTHPDLKHSARVRAFLEFFGTELARLRKILEGEAPRVPPPSLTPAAREGLAPPAP